MEFTVTTPGLLFPAISLLLLAFTNRFLALAALIRELYRQKINEERTSGEKSESSERIVRQISNLHKRVELIRSMQALGVLSFILCTLSMFALFMGEINGGKVLFGLSLVMLVMALIQSFREIKASVGALEVLLEDLGDPSIQSRSR